ncbi:hypothetical protein QFZ66_001423 [Streptomyces sp. B4I13]|nr:hypothetical protein [Streptomyces sp. B4I13]
MTDRPKRPPESVPRPAGNRAPASVTGQEEAASAAASSAHPQATVTPAPP